MPLPKTATLASIWKGLRDPSDYLRGVHGNMLLCENDHGSAFVRIGVGGDGLEPNYRVGPDKSIVDASMRELDCLVDSADEGTFLRAQTVTAANYSAFNGKNHKKIEQWGRDELHEDNWSSRSTGIDDVERLLNEAGHLVFRGK